MYQLKQNNFIYLSQIVVKIHSHFHSWIHTDIHNAWVLTIPKTRAKEISFRCLGCRGSLFVKLANICGWKPFKRSTVRNCVTSCTAMVKRCYVCLILLHSRSNNATIHRCISQSTSSFQAIRVHVYENMN